MNPFLNLSYVELEELYYEKLMLAKDANQRMDYAKAAVYEDEMKLIADAMKAYERSE